MKRVHLCCKVIEEVHLRCRVAVIERILCCNVIEEAHLRCRVAVGERILCCKVKKKWS